MGEVLGIGANMSELRRTRSGSLSAEECVTLQNLKDAWITYKDNGSEELLRKYIVPAETMLREMKQVYIKMAC